MSGGTRIRRVLTAAADGRSVIAADGLPSAIFRFGGEDGNVDPHELAGMVAGDGGAPAGPGEVVVADVHRYDPSAPPEVPEGSRGFDVEVVPGGATWRMVEMGPHREAPPHATATLDYDLVLAGEIELLLDEGPVRLRAGDAAILPGVAHGWRTGEEPCRMSVIQIGRFHGGATEQSADDQIRGDSLE